MTLAYPKPRHRRLVPKQGERGKFSPITRQIIYDRDDGKCQICNDEATEIHHVQLKSNGGRGAIKNGMCVCAPCHRYLHNNPEALHVWQKTFETRYGPDYWKDYYDE